MDLASSQPVAPLLALQARAEARALLWRCCEFKTIEQALAPLFDDATRQGLVDRYGEASIKALIEAPFVDNP
jgi:hypothetical protein